MTDDTVFTESDCPVNPKKGWLPFAIHDPAVLHISLLFSAWFQAMLQDKEPGALMMYHKMEGIRLLNRKIAQGNLVATDSIIAAVSGLAQFEVYVQR